MLINRKSQYSHIVRTACLPVSNEQMEAYSTRKLSLEKAFPHLTEAQRRFIQDGITAEEWHEILEGL